MLVPEPVQLGPARLSDAEAIALISREEVETGLGWRWRPASVAREIVRSDSEVVVARDGDRIVGFGIMRFLADDAHLLLLAVSQTHQRQGLGTRILEWLETMARTAGVFRVHLEVRVTRHAARNFYKRMGYREIRLLPGYYQGREAAIRVIGDLRARV